MCFFLIILRSKTTINVGLKSKTTPCKVPQCPDTVCVSVRLVMGEIEIFAMIKILWISGKKTKPRIHSQFSPVHLVLNKFMGPPIQWITQSKWTSPWLHRANNKFSLSWGCAQATVMVIFFFGETLSLSHSFLLCCPHLSTYLKTWRQKNLNSPLNLKNW